MAMPDSWYDPPDDPEPCEVCDDEGCGQCDREIAESEHADRVLQRAKEEPDYPYDEIAEAFKEARNG